MIKKVKSYAGLVGSACLLFPVSSFAQTVSEQGNAPKTEIMDIETNRLPPASAEEIAPKHPFFSETSPASEVMEEVEELKERLQKIEEKMENTKISTKPDGTMVIESEGPIEIVTPQTIKLIAKSVEMPKQSAVPGAS